MELDKLFEAIWRGCMMLLGRAELYLLGDAKGTVSGTKQSF